MITIPRYAKQTKRPINYVRETIRYFGLEPIQKLGNSYGYDSEKLDEIFTGIDSLKSTGF